MEAPEAKVARFAVQGTQRISLGHLVTFCCYRWVVLMLEVASAVSWHQNRGGGPMYKVIEGLLVLVGVLQWPSLTTRGQPGTNRQVFYAVEMDGGVRAARALAEQHGLEFISRIGNLRDHYTLKDSRGRPDRAALQMTLKAGAGVRWVQRQQNHHRDKRAGVAAGPGRPPDHGVDHTNPDLKRNFEAFASFDLRGVHGLSHDPMPRRDEENGHGTRCAGEVAMEANNSYCGVGIAFNARIGGIRLLDGSVTDAMEATALTFNNQFIDVYVCCWGPRDDGAEMGGPGPLTEKALRLGTHKGRAGKGSVFVWASGNGGTRGDHCGADGYVNSVHSVAIGAVTHTGKPAFFSEPCPGVMAVSLTGDVGGGSLPLVTVTNVGEGCVSHFTGTSSAAPIAAGIIALVLEAKYGFGVLDAGLMVQQALHFNTVLPHRKCTQEVTFDPARLVPSGQEVSITIQSDGCQGRDTEVNTLEHVQVTVSISSVCRGDLSIGLESPSGTASLLLAPRPNDASAAGLANWTLMTVHCWGERPRGRWTLKVTDKRGTVGSCVRKRSEEAAGALLRATLTLYGTYQPHPHTPDGPTRGIMAMGTYHPVPQTGVFVRDQYPPQDLIRWAFELERERKVGVSDIPVLQPRRKKSKQQLHPVQHFTSLDMDDTDGGELGSQLKELWNTLRDRLESNRTLPNTSTTRRRPPQVRLTDGVLGAFLGQLRGRGRARPGSTKTLGAESLGPLHGNSSTTALRCPV
ncbi:proprotein convertase subtilisin/kexin type 4-like [Aplochiton taeniatus]